MFSSTHDARTVPAGPTAALSDATPPLALWTRVLAALRRRRAAARMRHAGAHALAVQARAAAAANEACALEGAKAEFGVIELDGRSFGAVYIDGKLNCLLPPMQRL